MKDGPTPADVTQLNETVWARTQAHGRFKIISVVLDQRTRAPANCHMDAYRCLEATFSCDMDAYRSSEIPASYLRDPETTVPCPTRSLQDPLWPGGPDPGSAARLAGSGSSRARSCSGQGWPTGLTPDRRRATRLVRA